MGKRNVFFTYAYEIDVKGKSVMWKRIFDVFRLISAILFICVLCLLLFSHWIDPHEDRLSFSKDFHVSVYDRYLAFFNDPEYGPYRGSIIALDTGGQTPFEREVAFGYTLGVYYRYFKWADSNDVLWTLMLNLWYLLALFSIMPVSWCIRVKLRISKEKE